MDRYLNIFFFVFHTGFILFNLTGWIWRATRKIHLFTLLATVFSWFGLGIWYGFGYCPCTDWHWQVRSRMGFRDMESSYLSFLFRHLTGIRLAPELVNGIALGALVCLLILSLVLNLRERRKKRLRGTE